MAGIIGGLAAMVALAVGIAARVETVECLTRSGIAFAVGWFGGALWQAAIGWNRRVSQEEMTPPSDEPIA